jgi:hypothetical protein
VNLQKRLLEEVLGGRRVEGEGPQILPQRRRQPLIQALERGQLTGLIGHHQGGQVLLVRSILGGQSERDYRA